MTLADLIDDLKQKSIALSMARAQLEALISIVEQVGPPLDEKQTENLIQNLKKIAGQMSVALGSEF